MVGEGSPPHTRGKDGISEPLYHCCGITPAHAGKRNLDSGVPVPGGDHPRTRGEKHEFFDDDPEHTGSPPHTRGKGTAAHDIKGMFRITPAHAGKRTYRIICSPLRADHPRTRGEKEPDMKISGCQQGSPPHTRGKASRNAVVLMGDGITPAHAGKRRTNTGVLSSARDHPRTRGEKRLVIPQRLQRSGSPPHTRGKGAGSINRGELCRITPAHAGKRFSVRSMPLQGGDHPRTRGEKSGALKSGLWCGDHPRTRGEKL